MLTGSDHFVFVVKIRKRELGVGGSKKKNSAQNVASERFYHDGYMKILTSRMK